MPQEEKKTPSTLKVILKCNFKARGKDGKLESKKPDEEVTLSYGVAMDLIKKAWAVKA